MLHRGIVPLGNGSDGDPDQHDDNVQALGLAAVILESPHAILLLVPVGTGGAVHAASADVGLAVGGRGFGAGRHVRLLALDLGAAAGLVQGRGGHQVLDDGAVAGELVRRGGGALGSRLGDDGLEHRVNDGRVPLLRLGVVVEVDAANGAVADVGSNLLEAVEGNGRSSHCEDFGCCATRGSR
jgi:hypothetical protein